MKNKLLYITNFLTCILLIVCFFRIGGLQREIEKTNNNLSSYYNIIQSNISNIGSSVRYELEQAGNLVTEGGYDISSIDTENFTATLSCFIVPKEYNPDITKVSVICNDDEYPMSLENGKYIADIEVPVFYNSRVTAVHMNDNGTIRTQQLNWYADPKGDMLPQISAQASGTVSSLRDNGIATRKYSQDINVDIFYPAEDFTLKSAQLVAEIDSKEVYRKNVEWTSVHSSSGEPVEPYDSYAPLADDWVMGFAEFEENFDVPYNSNICIYLEFRDNMGLIYRNILDDVTIADNGEPVDNNIYGGGAQSDIYTSDGKPLYLKMNDEEYN